MSKKRRIFDVDLPDDLDAAPLETKSAVPRRGPMASAIGETAESVRARSAQEAAIRAENDALAHELVRLKAEGLIVDLIPVDAVFTTKLVRDRQVGVDPELEELKASLRDIGLSNPIRVEEVEGGYELVQGFRRLSAYRALLEETGDAKWEKIPAGLVAKGEDSAALYRRMVDENLVRKDISFAEMAELARAYVEAPGSGVVDVAGAVEALFQSAGRQKRAYIRNFASLLERLDKYLNFAQAIPRALGLAVHKRLEADPEALSGLVSALRAQGGSEDGELRALREFAAGQGPVSPRGQANVVRAAKATFRVQRPEGDAKCVASDGRLELRAPRDFSAVERRQLEKAVRAFFEALDG